MAKCASCGGTFGLLELKKGICKQCKNATNPPCLRCRKNFPEGALDSGSYCESCATAIVAEESARKELTSRLDRTREQREADEQALRKITLTTETCSNLNVVERIDVITSECVFGMNIFRDIFASVRDVFGGRSAATQTVLRDARKKVLEELRREAHSVGANAVIGVDLDYSEFSGGGKSMLFVVASGTAVRVDT